MADTWQTIEQAAVLLGLSVRTVNRHIVAGKLQSRLTDGRREVLVTPADSWADTSAQQVYPTAPAPAIAAAPTAVSDGGQTPADMASAFSHLPITGAPMDSETVLALADNAAEKADLAVAAYQALARVADSQVHQARRNARFAWAAVAVMAAGVTVAVGWATHRATRAAGDVESLQDKLTASTQTVSELSDAQDKLREQRLASERAMLMEVSARQDEMRADRAATELSLRNELAAARDEAARAEGALSAYRQQAARRPSRDASDVSAETSAEASDAKAVLASERISGTASTEPSQTAAPENLSDDATPALTDTPSDTAEGELSSASAEDAESLAPSTRPVALPDKVNPATTRAAAVSDTPSPSAVGGP